MKAKQRLLALLLAAVMVAATACGSSSTSSDSASADTASTEEAAPAAEEEAAPAEDESVDEAVEEAASTSQSADLVAAVSLDFTTMDPVDTSDTLSGGIQRMIMDGLFGFDDDYNIIPMLATGYEGNEDATEYTITLRQGITFSDGTAWNADAAKANLDKLGDTERGLKRTALLSAYIDTVEVVDEYTIDVKLSTSFGAFIACLAHPACVMMSPVQIEAGDDVCAKSPVGTGQYLFQEWEEGDHLTLTLNPNWWGYDADICGDLGTLADADAGFQSVTFKVVTEDATRVSMLQSGDAQLIWPVPSESYSVLDEDTNVTVYAEEGIVERWLCMNCQKEPFNDVRVREAIAHAISSEAYIQIVNGGLGSVPDSCIPSGLQGYSAQTAIEYNVDTAKQLLADAGYPDGFTTTLIYPSNTTNDKRAQFYQQQLAQVGITVELEGAESAIVNERIQDVDVPGSEAEVDLYFTGWSSSTGDADWGLRPLFCTDQCPPTNYNISYYSNTEFDQLIQDALCTSDQDKRNELYAEAQAVLWADYPCVFTSVDYNTWATSANVTGISLFKDGAINFRNGKMA